MGNRVLVALTFVLLAGAGCLSSTGTQLEKASVSAPPRNVPSIAAVGAFDVTRLEYDFGPVPLVFRDSRGVPYPSRLQGSVHFPAAGAGPFPLIVFMHGRHGTCAYAGFEFLGPAVCPDTPATKNVRSFAGYDYIAAPLASHGYVVASIDTNSINDLDLSMGDQGAVGRAQLISRTLDEFSKLNRSAGAAPIQGALVGRIDFGRFGLMGHSRGGEGVTRFISWNEQRTDGPRYPLQAVFALAPTDFARWKVANVTFATLLPYCDGDVSNLHGAWMFDDARYLDEAKPSPKIQILAMGSNHNNYNTVWTGDDGGGYRSDAHCGPSNPAATAPGGRLSPDDQRRHGRVYMEAFFRHYVGGEPGWNGLFTGRVPPPADACPDGQSPCGGVIHVSYHAPAPNRLTIEDTLDGTTLTKNDAGGAATFGSFVKKGVCVAAQCPPQNRYFGRANLLQLAWTEPTRYALEIPDAARNASRFDVLSYRAVVDPTAAQNAHATFREVSVQVVDESGATATVRSSGYSTALFVPPGAQNVRRAVPNEVRLPLAAFTGVDLSRIERVSLIFDAGTAGAVLFTDILLQDEPDD